MKNTVIKPIFNNFEVDASKYSGPSFIQDAIDEVEKNGGGYVYIPKGYYVSKPIYLKSGVCLKTEVGTFISFKKNKEWYPLYLNDYEGVKRIRAISPINMIDATNVGIIGKGIFDGDGFNWRPLKEFKLPAKFFKECLAKSNTYIETKEGKIWYPTKSSLELALMGDEPMPTEENVKKYQDNFDYFRPVFVKIQNCDKVLLDGPTFRNSPAWNVHPLFSTNLTVINCNIYNDHFAQNGDGIDIESCHDVLFKDNVVSVGDDGICIKSGKNREARQIKKPTYNIYILDNIVNSAHGGITFGSEMSRGIYDVYCYNNTFVGTDTGLRFKTQIGRGGTVKDILIENTRMYNIKEQAITFTCGYELYRMENESRDVVNTIAEDDIPEFTNITIKDLVCDGAKEAISMKGLEVRPINNIHFKDIHITAKKDYILEHTKDLTFENVIINLE